MAGTNTAVQLNQNSTPGAEMWVIQYSGIPGESGDVVAEVVNLLDAAGNVIGSSNPLPVSLTSASVVLNAASVAITNFPAIQTVAGSVSVQGQIDVGNFPASQTVAGSVSVLGNVNVNQLSTPWVVSGTVNAVQQGNWGASVTQGTSPWIVSGTVTALQGGNWGASVSNFPANQTVSGSVSVLGGTVTANQGGAPWIVDAIQQGNWGASVSNFPASQTIAGSVQLLPGSADIGYVGTWTTSGPIVGQTTSSVAAVPLTATSYVVTNGVLVQGLSTNIASVFIGPAGVASVGATGGFELQAGQAVSQTCKNANLIYIVGPNNTDGVCWTVL